MTKKTFISILIGLIIVASLGFNAFVIGSKVINDNNLKYYNLGFDKAKSDLYDAIRNRGSVMVVLDNDKSIIVTELKK